MCVCVCVLHELKPSTMINDTEWHQADLRVLVPFSFWLFRQPPVIEKWPFFCVLCNLDRLKKD